MVDTYAAMISNVTDPFMVQAKTIVKGVLKKFQTMDGDLSPIGPVIDEVGVFLPLF